jgi:ubiquinone/menaquinone biosynthesis C-methylase UbiE
MPGNRNPQIVNWHADRKFRLIAANLGRDPDDRWLGGYVEHEWHSNQNLVQAYTGNLTGQRVLEFGCNIGATAIIFSYLGAGVVAADIDTNFLELARANVDRYNARHVSFVMLDKKAKTLPLASQSFDVVSCNSVLEYVDCRHLAVLSAEFDRVLKNSGMLLVMGTSNRLWPREVHSGRWLVNYLPTVVDQAMRQPLQRGIWPWAIRNRFPRYRDLACDDRARGYLAARQADGASSRKLAVLRRLQSFARPFGCSAGALTPSIFLALRKPRDSG